MVEFGVAVPQQFLSGPSVQSAEIRRGLQEADQAGLHSAWVMEGIIGPMAQLEPVTLLSYVASVTSQLRLGLGVTILPLRSPVVLAKELATVDQLSDGRLIVGVGVGGDHTAYRAFGSTRSERVERFTRGLDVMRRLWAGGPVTVDTPWWTLDQVELRPGPLQNPLPVWIGARTESAVRRAVQMGDGFLGAGSCSTTEFARQLAVIADELAHLQRSRAGFPIAKRVYVAVDNDASRARGLLGDFFARLYGDRDRAAGAVAAGPVDACAEAIASVIGAGADLVVLNPVADEPDQIRRIVAGIVPAFEP